MLGLSTCVYILLIYAVICKVPTFNGCNSRNDFFANLIIVFLENSDKGNIQWRSVTFPLGGGMRVAKPYVTNRNSFVTFGINFFC